MPLKEAAASVDLLLVGGGLANGLIALRLSQLRPEIRVLVLEAGDRLGGQHTWCHFESDLTPEQSAWIAPLVVHRWPGYEVRFPAHERRLETGYACLTSDRFHDVLSDVLKGRIRLGARAASISPTDVGLENGERLQAGAVLDGRGPTETPDLDLAFQKFVGLEVRLSQPHGVVEPIMMDACVDQADGYRFIYVLPLDARTLLVEDTRYTDGPALDEGAFSQGVVDYVAAKGWNVETVIRQERGVLPVALGGDLAAHFDRSGPTATAGLRAGLFHPTTGYSLPDAVRLADQIARLPTFDGPALTRVIRGHAERLWNDRAFYRMLNRLLLRAARPERRYRVFERFYRLPQPLIERFYAGKSTRRDKVRVLTGRPPVPVIAALGQLRERSQ